MSIERNKTSTVWAAVEVGLIFAWLTNLMGTDSFHNVYILCAVLGVMCLADNVQQGRRGKDGPRVGMALLAAGFSAATVVANYPLFQPVLALTNLFKAGCALLGGFVLGYHVLLCGVNRLPVRGDATASTTKRNHPVRFFLICFGAIGGFFLLYLFCVGYPGYLSTDSLNSLDQIRTGVFQNNNPFWYTKFIEVWIRLGMAVFGEINAAVAVYSSAQILIMAVCFAYGLVTLYQAGIPGGCIGFAFSVYTFLPYNITYSITMWKDTLFGGWSLAVMTALYRILKQIGTDGKTIREYEYDLKGNVIREVDALGQDKCFRYDEAGRMTGVWEYVSPDEYRVTFYKYDDMDQVTEEKRGLHGVGKFETPTRYLTIKKTYDKEGRLVTVSDMSMEMQYTYDMMNNRTSETAVIDDRGTQRTVYYRYDKNGRLVEKKEDAGDKTLSVTAYTYDASDNLTGVTLPEGGKIFLIYDEAERLIYKLEREDRHHILRGIRYTYADFCPVSAEQLYGRQTTVREMNQLLIGMDSNALREFLNPEGADSEKLCQERATEQAYYQGKEALAVFHAFEKAYGNIENGDSHRYEKALKEGLCGEPDTGKESSSYNRHYVWDFRGNLLKQKDSLGGTWKYVYDLTGRLASATNPVGDKTSYVYDRFGRERSRINGIGDCEYTLDYDALGRVTARTDGEGNTTTFAYHPGGQIRTVTAPNGAKLYQAEYDVWGRPDSETDGNGNTTVYEKDRWGHVTKVTLPDGGIEKYHYDYAGNLNVAEDANGNRTVFRYNGNNQLRSIEKENKSIRSFVYDAEGRCIRSLDANGNLVETVYNMDSNPVMVTGSRKPDTGNMQLPTIRSLGPMSRKSTS